MPAAEAEIGDEMPKMSRRREREEACILVVLIFRNFPIIGGIEHIFCVVRLLLLLLLLQCGKVDDDTSCAGFSPDLGRRRLDRLIMLQPTMGLATTPFFGFRWRWLLVHMASGGDSILSLGGIFWRREKIHAPAKPHMTFYQTGWRVNGNLIHSAFDLTTADHY